MQAVSILTLLVAQQHPVRPSLIVGNMAPPLVIDKWIQGKEISQYERGKVYVIETWATWCGPCLAAMPHLNKMSATYGSRGVVVIGLTGADDYGNTEKSIRDVVKAKKLSYSIALDHPTDKAYMGVFKGETTKSFVEKAGVQTIPVTFVVDKNGKLAFIGHPMESVSVVKKILEERFDLSLARAAYLRRVDAQPDLDRYVSSVASGEHIKANDLGRKLVKDSFRDDAHSLLVIAVAIQTTKKPVGRNLSLSLEAARRAAELTHWGDPGYISCVAMAYYQLGKPRDAIRYVKQAIAMAEGGQRDALKRDLAKYQGHNG